MTIMGVEIYAHFGLGLSSFDLSLGLKLDFRKLNALIVKGMQILYDIFPIDAAIIETVDKVLGALGVKLPFPIIKIDYIEIPKISLVGFFTGKDDFIMKWNVTLFGTRFADKLEFGLASLAKGLGNIEAYIDAAWEWLKGFLFRKVPKILVWLFNANPVVQFLGMELKLIFRPSKKPVWVDLALEACSSFFWNFISKLMSLATETARKNVQKEVEDAKDKMDKEEKNQVKFKDYEPDKE